MSKEAGSAVYNINMLYRIMEEHWKLTRSNNNCCTFHLWPKLEKWTPPGLNKIFVIHVYVFRSVNRL